MWKERNDPTNQILKQRKTVSELKFTYKYIISTDLTNSWKIEKLCTMAVIGQGHGLNRYWVVWPIYSGCSLGFKVSNYYHCGHIDFEEHSR